jgi:hypothetical protein
VSVHLPDGATAESTHIGALPIPGLPPGALQAHVFPAFTGSLLSIGQTCDADPAITATFNSLGVRIHRGDETIVQGPRHPTTKIYEIEVAQRTEHPAQPSPSGATMHPDANGDSTYSAAPVIRSQSDSERVRFYLAALGSPVFSTFLDALRTGILHLPHLTTEMARKNQHHSIKSAIGHLTQERQGLRSSFPTTETSPKPPPPGKPDQPAPPSDDDDDTLTCRLTRYDDALFADYAGRFPMQSRRGYQYVLLTTRRGYLHMELLSSKTAASCVKAYATALQWWEQQGLKPRIVRLDNETSKELEAHFRDVGVDFQYAPPNNHRASVAERGVQTIKHHIIATLATCDPQFPLLDWDLLIPHAELTVNLLRPCKLFSSFGRDLAAKERPFHHFSRPSGKVVFSPECTSKCRDN